MALGEPGEQPAAGYAPGEFHTPVDYARRPESPARAWFTDEEIERALDRLAAERMDDGGWPVKWRHWNQLSVLEYRGAVTIEARLGLQWNGHDRWSAGALLRGVARQSRVAPGQGNVVGRDLDPTPGFATLALNAAYRINDNVQISAGVDNVFDRQHAEHLNLAGSADFGYPADPVRIAEPGRTAWLRVGLSY